MAKSRVFFLRSKLLAIRSLMKILGLSGLGFFAACDPYGSPVAEYGVVSGDYKEIEFHGTIISEDSLQVIPFLLVKLYQYGHDTVVTKTDSNGAYSIFKYSLSHDIYKISVSDTDSIANGGDFLTKTIEVEVNGRDMNNGDHLTNILLERK